MDKIIEAQDRLADARALLGAILHIAAEDWDGPSNEIHAVAMAAQDKVEVALALLAEGKESNPVAAAAQKILEASAALDEAERAAADKPHSAGRATEDPIFAAIERHRAAEARYGAAATLTDDVAAEQENRLITKRDRAEFEAAEQAEKEALTALLATMPLTSEGVLAAMRYIAEAANCEQDLIKFLETLAKSPVLAD
jgi:hypothetical protein